MPRLEVFRKGRRVSEHAVPPSGVVLGRDVQARIRLLDKYVSRCHARIYPLAGDWVIEDLATRNGTFVNGVKEQRRALKRGDRLEIGPFVVLWGQTPDEKVPADVTPPGPCLRPREQEGTDGEQHGNTDPERTEGLDPNEAAKLREEARALMGPRLVQTGDQELVYPLLKAENIIGDGEAATVRIAGTGRAQAALLEFRPDGSVVARRLGWFSSMKVNGTLTKECVLTQDAELELGTVKLRFVSGPKPGANGDASGR